MDARALVVGYAVFRLLIDFVLATLSDCQRKKPLPDSVADVYTPERYRDYLASVADYRKASLVSKLVDLGVLGALVYGGFYNVVDEAAHGSPYLVIAYTLLLVYPLSVVLTLCLDYYETFVIDERYGLNKSTKREFAKDEAITLSMGAVVEAVALNLVAFLGEHIPIWTRGFTAGAGKAAIVCAILIVIAMAFGVFGSALGLLRLKLSYTIEPLPEGDLRSRVFSMACGSKRKLRQVYVYNESTKSTDKNAAAINIPGHHVIVIADNFLNENDSDELLATLAHEIGHLKERWDAWTTASAVINAGVILALFWLIFDPSPILAIVAWTQESFGLATINYYLVLVVLAPFLWLPSAAIGIFGNCQSRHREYNADQEAVRQGLGQQLITMLKDAEGKALMNVNPHPVVEFLEYDHPGLANRISAIRAGMESRLHAAE